jgi:hypothetical protein
MDTTLFHGRYRPGVRAELTDGEEVKEIQGPQGRALFSDDGRYRYKLERWWDRDEKTISHPSWSPNVTFVMLNPSTADAFVEDPTIRRCIGFARQWGFNHLVVVNLFAFRATNPRWLTDVAYDPVGPDNQIVVRAALEEADKVICAWGNHGALRGAGDRLRSWMDGNSIEPFALHMSKLGQPGHPLYLPASSEPFSIKPLAPQPALAVESYLSVQ